MIKKILNRDAIKLTIGSGIGQIIAVFSAPILSRFFSPEAFGLSALFFSVIGLFSVIICLRYENAIVVSTDKESANLLTIGLILSFIISMLILLFIFYFKHQLIIYFNIEELSNYIFLLPLLLFFTGIYNSLNSWLIRKREFSILSIGGVSNQIVTTSFSIFSGVIGRINGGSLIFASFIGQLVLIFLLIVKVLKNDFRYIKNNVSKFEIRKALIKYKKFPIFGSFGALINAASWQFPIILMGYFFSNGIIGYYSFGFRLLQLPMSIVGNSIGQVFFQQGASHSSILLKELVINTFKKLFCISVLPSIILFFTGANIFEIIFGASWREAGVFVQLLAPWTFFWFLSSPLAWIYTIKEKQKEELYFHSIIFIVRLFSVLIGGYFFTPRITIFLFSITGVLIYSLLLFKIFNYSEVKMFNLTFFIKKQSYFIIPFIIFMIFSVYVFKLNFYLLITYSLLYMFYYYFRNKSIFNI